MDFFLADVVKLTNIWEHAISVSRGLRIIVQHCHAIFTPCAAFANRVRVGNHQLTAVRARIATFRLSDEHFQEPLPPLAKTVGSRPWVDE